MSLIKGGIREVIIKFSTILTISCSANVFDYNGVRRTSTSISQARNEEVEVRSHALEG